MNNVIWFPFDPDLRRLILELHFNPDGGFKSANEIAEMLEMRVSIVKAVLRRGW